MFLIIWGVMVGLLNASEISYAPLANVIKEARWIIKANVVSISRKDTAEANQVAYSVVPITVLKGLPVVPEKVSLTYTETIPVIRDTQGKPMGWASPIFSGCGKEFYVKLGEEWIFFLEAKTLSETQPTSILRVQPVSNETEIRNVLAQSSMDDDVISAPQP